MTPAKPVKIFWNRVKARIKEQGLTLGSLAKKCGIPANTFYGWIAKSIIPSLPDTCRIARFLGLSVEYLWTGKEPDHALALSKIRALLKQAEQQLETLEKKFPPPSP